MLAFRSDLRSGVVKRLIESGDEEYRRRHDQARRRRGDDSEDG